MSNQYFLARLGGRDPNLRAGDADRERIADRLRRSHAEGRLDLAEFQERLELCYQARTFGQLDGLVRDLPRDSESVQRAAPWAAPPHWRPARWLALLTFLLIAAAVSHHHFFWLWIPAVFIIWRLSWRHRRSSSAGRRDSGGWI